MVIYQQPLSPVRNPDDLIRHLATDDAELVVHGEPGEPLGGYFEDFVCGLRDELEAGGESPLAKSKVVEDAAYLLSYCQDRGFLIFAKCVDRSSDNGSRPTNKQQHVCV